MSITPTTEAISLTTDISKSVKTFHHHFHILYDIARLFEGEINYVEIGCYAGASACLMLQRPNTNVFSIDTGEPIPMESAIANIASHNHHGNKTVYIKGNSHHADTIKRLRTEMKGGIDILFIDGGHSYHDVTADFALYENMVKPGGYIVFDDYMDYQFSPEVKPAVDAIVVTIPNKYDIIGTIRNTLGAHPSGVEDGNCFVIRKKDLRIGVVISTYMRPDGKTPFYLRRALNCIKNQTFKNYWIYLIGDKYDNEQELMDIASQYDKITCINLPYALERDKYQWGDFRLWCTGGMNAVLTGITKAIDDGIEYICHLDHDDQWTLNHLDLFAGVIITKTPFFICTMSSYSDIHLPYQKQTGEVVEFLPAPGGMVASSSCIKYSDTRIRLRDVFEATGKPNPGDADLWFRLAEEMRQMGKRGFLVRTLSCRHDEEGYVLHG